VCRAIRAGQHRRADGRVRARRRPVRPYFAEPTAEPALVAAEPAAAPGDAADPVGAADPDAEPGPVAADPVGAAEPGAAPLPADPMFGAEPEL